MEQQPGASSTREAVPNHGQGPFQPIPLERTQFERTLQNFFLCRNFACDMHSLMVDGRPLDLHALHQTVFEMGGFCKVEASNAWDIVGGKLGFVHFPGSDGQPPRSGPGISLQITQCYKDYVQEFDAAYMRSVFEAKFKNSTGAQELNDQHRAQILQMVRAYTGFDLGTGVAARPVNPQQKMVNEQQMAQLVSFAHRTVAELRQANVPEHVIQLVEARRPDLLRIYQDQVNLKGTVQNGDGGMRYEQSPAMMQSGAGGPGGMGGRPIQPPSGTAAGGLPGQMQAHRMGVAGGQGNIMSSWLHGPGGMQVGGALGPPLPQHQQAGPVQRMMPGMAGQMTGPQFHVTTPTEEHIQIALVQLAKHRRDAQEAINHLQPIDVSPDQRAAYSSQLENVHRLTLDLEPKLPVLYSLIKNEERIGRVIKIITTVQFQHTLCSESNPRIIVPIEALRSAHVELFRLNEAFCAAMKKAEIVRQNQGPQEHPLKQVEESASQEQVDLLSGALSSLDLSVKSYDSP